MTQDPLDAAWGGAATADPLDAAWDAPRAWLPPDRDAQAPPEPEPLTPWSAVYQYGIRPAFNVPIGLAKSAVAATGIATSALGRSGLMSPEAGAMAQEVGQAEQGYAEREIQLAPSLPGREEETGTRLADSLAFVGGALAVPGSAAVKVGAGAGASALEGFASSYHVVESQTGDPDKALLTALGVGAVDAVAAAVPLNRITKRLGGKTSIGQVIADGFIFGGTSGAQDALTQAIEGAATGRDLKDLIDWTRTLEAAKIGGLTGLIVGSIQAAASRRPQDASKVKAAPESDPAPIVQETGAQEAISPDSGSAVADPTLSGAKVGDLASKAPADPLADLTGQPIPIRDTPPEPLPYKFPELAKPEQPTQQRPVVEGPFKPSPREMDPATAARMDELMKLPRKRLENELLERLEIEDEILRNEKGGRGDAWYARVAEMRRQVREPGNPEAPQAQQTLQRLKIEPSGQRVEEVISALRVRDDMDAAERAARKGARPAEKFERAQAARAEIEAAWKEFGDHLRGKSFSGVDPVTMQKAAKVAKAYVKAGAQGFADFARDAIEKYGEEIRAHVHDIWRKAGGAPMPLKERKRITHPEPEPVEVAPKNSEVEVATPPVSDAMESGAPSPESSDAPARVAEDAVATGKGDDGAPPSKAPEAAPAPPLDVRTEPKFGNTLEGRFEPNVENAREMLRRQFVDKWAPVRDAEKAVSGKENLSDAETVFHGRVGARADWIDRRVNQIAKIGRQDGATLDEVGEFMYARHVADRETALGEGAAGMSAAEAQTVLAKYENRPAFKRIAAISDMIQRRKLDLLEKSGALTAEQRKAWEEKFGKTYVPLKSPSDPAEGHLRGAGGSFSVRGPESKQAKGRGSEAYNPLVQSIQDAYEAVYRSEKVRVGKEMLDVVRENPAPELWQEYTAPDEIPTPDRGKVFHTKEAGQDRYIVLHDKRMFDAVQGLGMDSVPRVLRWASATAQVYKKLHTVYSPDFLASNVSKDLQTAGLNLSSKESVALAAKVVANMPRATKAMARVLMDENAKGKYEDYAREFRDEGGMTNWTERKTIQQREKDLRKALQRGQLFDVMAAAPRVIEGANMAAENGTRLSTYIQMREAGYSKRKAAVASKNTTTNFDRRGNLSPTLNTLYLFSNAGIQGTATTLRMIKHNPGKALSIAGSLAALGYFVSHRNRIAGGEDPEDGENRWEKESLDRKAHSFEWMSEDGSVTKFPLPWLWGSFFHLGTMAEHMVNGTTPPMEAAGSMGASFAGSVSPISGGSPAQWITPWFLDPVVQVSENKDWRGSPIRPHDFGSKLPAASRKTFGASELTVEMSRALNQISGGNAGRQGALDISPDTLDHLAGEAVGGAGKFLQRVWKTAENVMRGKETPWTDVPILNRFKGDPSPYHYEKRFRENRDAIETEKAAMKAGVDFDRDVLRWDVVASRYERIIKAARDAGDDDKAAKSAAEFNRRFAARRTQK